MSYKWGLLRQRWTSSDIQLKRRETLVMGEKNTVKHSEKASALECLPAEILNVIAQFLSVKELLCCSAACTRLRAVLNDNVIWRRFCKEHVIRYLSSIKPKMDLEYDTSTLTHHLDPICDERLLYMQQNQLLNNWKNGRFKEHEIHSTSGLYYMGLKSGTSIIFQDTYLFLYDFYSHTIVVWNIQACPVQYTNIRLLYHNYFYEGLHYEIVGRKLIVCEVGKLIQIYDINLPDRFLPLVRMIIFDRDEPLSKVPEFTSPEEMYTVCSHRVIGSRIYSHKIGKPILHIWDVESGRKIRALQPPKSGSDIDILSAANNGNDLVLCLEIKDSQRQLNALGIVYEVLSYSFSRDFFKTIWTNIEASTSPYIPFHAVQHGELVLLFCRLNNLFVEDTSLPKTVLVLYDYKWGVIIGEKSFPELLCHRQIKVVNYQLLLATTFCIYSLDIRSLDIINSFRFDNGKIELLNVFDGKFIIITPKSLLTESKTKMKEVWDIKNRSRCVYVSYIFMNPYSKDTVFINQSFTKMVIVGKGTLGVLHFW